MMMANPPLSSESGTSHEQLTPALDGPARLALARALLSDCLAGSPTDLLSPRLAAQLDVGWLFKQGLAALVWRNWRGKAGPGISVDFTRHNRAAYYTALAQDQLRRRELQAALAAFNRQGLGVVAFKGAALAHTVYPDSVCRGMSDLDFWVKADQVSQAQAVMDKLGYRVRFKSTRPVAMAMQNGGEIQYFGADASQGLVELHLGVFPGEWLRRVANVDESGIWSRTQSVLLAGQPACILDSADSLIQICIHYAISHNASMPWLRSLVDVTLLARHQPLDWSVIVQRAREWRVATATWLVLSLAVDVCGLSEAADAARQLAPSHRRQKLIGLFANAQALVDMRDLSRSKWRYVYLLLMVDRKRDAVKLIYRALWPESEWLQARYGKTGWHTRVQHLLDAARGRI